MWVHEELVQVPSALSRGFDSSDSDSMDAKLVYQNHSDGIY